MSRRVQMRKQRRDSLTCPRHIGGSRADPGLWPSGCAGQDLTIPPRRPPGDPGSDTIDNVTLLQVLSGEVKRTDLDLARSLGIGTTMDRRQGDPGGGCCGRVGER